MKKIVAASVILFGLIFLPGCAQFAQSNVTVLDNIKENPVGKKFAIYPLDKDKSQQLEYKVISQYLSNKLAAKGMIPVNPANDYANWFILLDYGVELGIERPYDRAFLMIVYDEHKEQIYKARILSSGASQNIVSVAPAFIDYLTSDWPGKTHAGETVNIQLSQQR